MEFLNTGSPPELPSPEFDYNSFVDGKVFVILEIPLMSDPFSDDEFVEQIRENPTVSQFEMEEGIVS